jgi:hypothetical protein
MSAPGRERDAAAELSESTQAHDAKRLATLTVPLESSR